MHMHKPKIILTGPDGSGTATAATNAARPGVVGRGRAGRRYRSRPVGPAQVRLPEARDRAAQGSALKVARQECSGKKYLKLS